MGQGTKEKACQPVYFKQIASVIMEYYRQRYEAYP